LGTLQISWVVDVWYGVILEPWNHISTSMSSALDLWLFDPKFDREHLPPMGTVVYKCDMLTLGEKSNILEPRNRISMSSALDLLTPKSIGNIILLWVVYMCEMVSLGGKVNSLKARDQKPHFYFDVKCAWPLTFWPQNQ
jgi:hypothetical protein